MKIIGVIGQNGSGKDEVLKYLRTKYAMPFLSTGDIVREIAVKEDKEPTRENLQEISQRYFREFGRGYFVKQAVEKIRDQGWETGGITGIRSLEDVQILKRRLNKDFILINIYVSDPKIRYQRMLDRGEERDPHNYSQFLQNDRVEEEIFHIQSASQYANYSICNDGTLDDLRKEIDKLVTENSLLT